MVRMTLLLLLAIGCSTKPADDKGATPGRSGAMTPSGAMGSAMGTTTTPEIDAAVIADAAPAKTADDLAKRYDECNRFVVEQRWDQMRTCYAPAVAFETPGADKPRTLDAEIEHQTRSRADFPTYTQEPQLVLVSGTTIIAILRVAGTGPDKKQFGIYLGHVVEADAEGRFTKDVAFFDAKTVAAQLGNKSARAIATGFPTKIALISKGDDVERANLATFAKLAATDDTKDVKAFGALLADDLVWSIQDRPKDLTKAELLAGVEQRFKSTTVKFTTERVWAAGDYVASIEHASGTGPNGPVDRRVLAIHRFASGKVAQAWIFRQG